MALFIVIRVRWHAASFLPLFGQWLLVHCMAFKVFLLHSPDQVQSPACSSSPGRFTITCWSLSAEWWSWWTIDPLLFSVPVGIVKNVFFESDNFHFPLPSCPLQLFSLFLHLSLLWVLLLCSLCLPFMSFTVFLPLPPLSLLGSSFLLSCDESALTSASLILCFFRTVSCHVPPRLCYIFSSCSCLLSRESPSINLLRPISLINKKITLKILKKKVIMNVSSPFQLVSRCCEADDMKVQEREGDETTAGALRVIKRFLCKWTHLMESFFVRLSWPMSSIPLPPPCLNNVPHC